MSRRVGGAGRPQGRATPARATRKTRGRPRASRARSGSSPGLALENLPATLRADLAPLFSESVTTLPADEPRRGAAGRLLEATTALLRSLAARGPVLCVLEDVHWADDTSLRLLTFASRWVREEPVLIAVSARTEDVDETGALGEVLAELVGEAA